MGMAMDVTCNQCGYNERFFIGSGFNYDPNSIFHGDMTNLRMTVIDPVERLRVRDIIFSHPNAYVPHSDSCIYRCPYCHKLYGKYYFKILYGDESYSPSYVCSRCECKLERLDCNGWEIFTDGQFQVFHSRKQPLKLWCPNCIHGPLELSDGHFDWC